MKLVHLICLSVILALFSSVFSDIYLQLLRMESRLEETKKKYDSLIFISQSFCKVCQGEGFSSFEEWEAGCGSLWQLDSIKWECVNSSLYCGKWTGPYGNGEVYARKK